MLITGIEPQKKNKNRVNIYIDGSFYCSLSHETVLKHRIKVGLEITKEELDNAVLDSEKTACFSFGLKYVARKMCTKKETKDYLQKKGFCDVCISFALDKLLEYNYINDKEYAKAYVNYSGAQKGVLKIKYDLNNKGIKRDIIDKEIENIISTQNDVCKRTAEKYLLNKGRDIKVKAALYRFLLSKGFTQDVVSCVVKELFAGGEYDE